MAAQQGFLYEQNAVKLLKKYDLVPSGFTPAGAGSDQPDLMLKYNKQNAGCELKIMAASAGSLVLKFNNATKSWSFGNIDYQDEEKMFIKKLAEQVKLFDIIKQKWKKIPHKRDQDASWWNTSGKLKPRQRYENDLKNFPDIRGEISAKEIEKYYNRKDTYYVNVGTHGFFLMGTKNPLSLKGLPRFGNSAKAIYRARVQYKGNDNYQFTFEMQFSMLSKSPYNIAPVKGNTVNIYKPNLNLSVFGIE